MFTIHVTRKIKCILHYNYIISRNISHHQMITKYNGFFFIHKKIKKNRGSFFKWLYAVKRVRTAVTENKN